MIYFSWQLLTDAREVVCNSDYLSKHSYVACYNCFAKFSRDEILKTEMKLYYDTMEYLCPNCDKHLIGDEFPIESLDFLDAMSALWYNGTSIEHMKRGFFDGEPTTDELLKKFSGRWKIINFERTKED